jgi:hypothetical protein
MIFEYNRKANIEIWNETMGAKEMFGMKFPNTFSVTPKDEEQAKKIATKFATFWDKDEEMKEKIFKIYGYKIPDKKLVCYINTSRWSSVGPKTKYISLSMLMPIEYVPPTIVHEFSHVAFYIKWGEFCRKIGYTENGVEELKEVLTVINNIEFKDLIDRGYKVHKEFREIVKNIWLSGKNLKEIISDPKIIESVNSLDTIKRR